jgi:hypothetical protein
MRLLATGFVVSLPSVPTLARDDPTKTAGPRPDRVQVSPQTADAEVGQTVAFKAEAFDAAGTRLDAKPSAWFATPFDVGAADPNGVVTLFAPGELRVGAIINGKPGFARVRIKPQTVVRLEIDAPAAPVVVGGGVALEASGYSASGVPRRDAAIAWLSETPAIAAVDAAGFATGLAPGRATVRATSDAAHATVVLQVVRNPVTRLRIEPATTRRRTGDVVRFTARAEGAGPTPPVIRRSVGGPGAAIDADGGFVAEAPGTYVVTATAGDRAAAASVIVAPRNAAPELEVVGRTPLEEFQTMGQWTIGDFVYATSAISGKLWVYDTRNASAPVKVDSLSFDARIVNDISVTADGRSSRAECCSSPRSLSCSTTMPNAATGAPETAPRRAERATAAGHENRRGRRTRKT